MPLQPVVVRQHSLLITSSQSFPPLFHIVSPQISLTRTHTLGVSQTLSLFLIVSLSEYLSLTLFHFSESLTLFFLRVSPSLGVSFSLSECLSLSESFTLNLCLSLALIVSHTHNVSISLVHSHSQSLSASLSLFTVSPSNI